MLTNFRAFYDPTKTNLNARTFFTNISVLNYVKIEKKNASPIFHAMDPKSCDKFCLNFSNVNKYMILSFLSRILKKDCL